jgi:high-affinity Fe2+/Pb2+ permease
VLVICAAAVPGFFVGLFVDEKTSTDPVLNSFLNGLIGALGYSVCAAYIIAVVLSWMKGKRVFAVIGIIMLFVPGMSLLPVIGAIRVARPNSTWARKYYGPEKMQIARARFPKDALRS